MEAHISYAKACEQLFSSILQWQDLLYWFDKQPRRNDITGIFTSHRYFFNYIYLLKRCYGYSIWNNTLIWLKLIFYACFKLYPICLLSMQILGTFFLYYSLPFLLFPASLPWKDFYTLFKKSRGKFSRLIH